MDTDHFELKCKCGCSVRIYIDIKGMGFNGSFEGEHKAINHYTLGNLSVTAEIIEQEK